VTVSYRQRRIPDAILGRVNALFRLLGWGSMPIGMMLAGAAVAAFEPSLGRELALRLPFLLASIGLSAMLVYATLAIRLR
ncbi:MAG: MFS transporter, partial [Pseudomonadota bacterium]